jgi:RimJ/RimL family protein N-acetyltransferase
MTAERARLTTRLRLVPIGVLAAVDLEQLHQDQGIAGWYGGRYNATQAREQASAMGDHWSRHGIGKWLAYSRKDGSLVGRGGLSWAAVLGQARLEVGWAVGEQLWGSGFATEIGREALRVAFDDLRVGEVVAFTEVHNLRSRRVMARLGLSYEQIFRRAGLMEGRDDIHDDAEFALYRVTAQEWARQVTDAERPG